jgi:hypothetical protein
VRSLCGLYFLPEGLGGDWSKGGQQAPGCRGLGGEVVNSKRWGHLEQPELLNSPRQSGPVEGEATFVL